MQSQFINKSRISFIEFKIFFCLQEFLKILNTNFTFHHSLQMLGQFQVAPKLQFMAMASAGE